jgi:hypothetical protein
VGEPFDKLHSNLSSDSQKNNKGKEKKRKTFSECMEALDEGKKDSPQMQVTSISLIV